MASKVGSLGRNFLEGTDTSDSLYGDSSGTLSSGTAGATRFTGTTGLIPSMEMRGH
jgi:hypothetical protein